MRDYFATQVSAQVSDPKIVMNLMRHTSLNTTTLYTRTVTERMKHAIQNLGNPLEAGLGGSLDDASRRKKTQKDMLVKLALRRLLTHGQVESSEFSEGKEKSFDLENGGRSRSRTYDLAHVRRAL